MEYWMEYCKLINQNRNKMKLSLNITPKIYQGPTHESIMDRVGYVNCYGTYGQYSTKCEQGYARVYNIEKVNKKTKQSKINNPFFNLPRSEAKYALYTKSTVVTKKHWVAYVYDIKIEVLKTLGIQVIQGKRNFIIKPIKRF